MLGRSGAFGAAVRLARRVRARGWPGSRVAAGGLAGALLVSAALLGPLSPLLAQAGGVAISLGDLSAYPTHTTVDRFEVTVSNLTATASYEVIASRDRPTLGIGACGTAAQTQKVTGVAARTLTFVVYACAEGSGTVTAAVRPSGSTTSLATVSQRLLVEPVPELAPGTGSGSTARAAGSTSRSVARAGTPGLVPSIIFPFRAHNSVRVAWGTPSDGDEALTGFGLLLWRTQDTQPAYSSALVKGAGDRGHTYTGLQANTTYKFRIHACNGADSCGWWTHPPKEVSTPPEPPTPVTATPTATATATAPTVGPPGQVRSLSYSSRTATSFTATWDAPSSTGGASLTGFGILQWEKSDSRPPDSEATNLGAGVRSKTFSGLKYGRSQGVEIRACNGPNRCSAWASLTVPAMAGLLPTIALPKTSIEIGERIKVGANDLPVGAVAYLQLEGPIQPRGRCSSSSARTRAVPRAPSPSTGPGYYDSAWIDGCEPGGDAVIRLESQDGSVLYDKRTLTVVSIKPGQVARPVVSARDGGLHVDWAAPTSGGTPSHYDLQYREGTSGAWTLVENITRTSYTITDLTNGTSYDVQVRAANTAQNGDWSEIATGTPQVGAAAPVNPGTGEPTLAPPACDRIPDPGSTAPTSLGQPTNLHVRPFQNRRAILSWNPVPGAAKYVVQIRQRTSTGWGDWLPPDRRTGETASGDVVHNCYLVSLDRVIRPTSGSSEGLADSVAYGLRLRAVNGTAESAVSSEAIIIDSPIIEANGKSSAGAPQVKLTWLAIGDILGSDYALGTYAVHHRRVGGNHRELGWGLDTFHPVEVFSQSSANPDTIDENLTMEEVYAIQLRYEETGPQRTSTVFAARDAYAWPSARAADGGERVATFPMHYRVKNRTYAYRICQEGFPGNYAQWENLVNHALGQWQLATNGLVRMVHEPGSCADYQTVLKRVRAVYVNFIGQQLTSDQLAALEGLVESMDIFTDIQVDDTELSEIIMVHETPTGIHGELWTMGVFPGMSEKLGLATCVFEGRACAEPRHEHRVRGWVTDILLPWSAYRRHTMRMDVPGGTDPGGGVTVDRDDVVFNTCTTRHPLLYEHLVHEAGHVLGIRNGSGKTGWSDDVIHHPSIAESVMSYEGVKLKKVDPMSMTVLPDDPDCEPHPLDVMAVYALYQQDSGA